MHGKGGTKKLTMACATKVAEAEPNTGAEYVPMPVETMSFVFPVTLVANGEFTIVQRSVA